MRICDCFQQTDCVFSIEVFPPKKTGAAVADLFPVLDAMRALSPDFISVTYGAGGGAVGNATCEIAAYLKHTLQIEPLAHLTCVNARRAEVEAALQNLAKNGIENILALRGDRAPEGADPQDFRYASDLAAFIHEKGAFSLAGACYPEGHVECDNLRQDVENLRYKLEAGVEHLITQLFFDNGSYFRLLNMARKAGYTVPIQAGIMPIVNARQVQRIVALSSASLPARLTKILSRYDHDPAALFDAGIEYAVQQLRDLMIGGADGVHLYAMNNPEVARRVYEGIADLLPSGGETCL